MKRDRGSFSSRRKLRRKVTEVWIPRGKRIPLQQKQIKYYLILSVSFYICRAKAVSTLSSLYAQCMAAYWRHLKAFQGFAIHANTNASENEVK